MKSLDNEGLRDAVKGLPNHDDLYDDETSNFAWYGDISEWNVSKVTDMSGLFKGRKYFNEDISGWDCRNVENMRDIFLNAENFDTKYVEDWETGEFKGEGRYKKLNNDMLRLVLRARVEDRKSTYAFFGHISDWDVSEVTDMKDLFKGAKDFNEDISAWDVSNVTDMTRSEEQARFAYINGQR